MNASVVIDPGHGGKERAGGSSPNNAVAPNGLLEKDLTLDLARRVAAALAGDVSVTLTRTGDANSSLSERAAVAKAVDADVFVSIHFNGWDDPAVDGSEAWVAKHASDASRALARGVLDRVVAVTQGRDRGVREDDLGVLLPARHGPRTAATLVELAFLTNPQEAERLRFDHYRQALAQAIADAIDARLPARVALELATHTPPVPASARVDGIDCDQRERLAAWSKLQSDGITFVIARATLGGTRVDDGTGSPSYVSYAQRHSEARANHFVAGAYHYSWAHEPLTGATAFFLDQANNFVGAVGRLLPGDLPPSFDYEETDCTADVGWLGAQWLDPMETFLDRVETALGRVPMIYTSRRVWHQYVQDDPAFARFGDYPLWVADYMAHLGIAPNQRYANRLSTSPALPAPWSDWALWQYTDATPTEFTELHKVATKIDADVCNGGIHVLRGLANLGRPAPVAGATPAIAYADENGTIMLLALVNGSWLESNLSERAEAAAPGTTVRAAGDVAACEVAGKVHVAFRGRDDNHLYELVRDGGTYSVTDLTTDVTGIVAASDPSYAVAGGDRSLVYWGEPDRHCLVRNSGGSWQSSDVTNEAGLEHASGDAALVASPSVHVVARAGLDGHLLEAWRTGATWTSIDLTDRSSAAAATYQPATYVAADGSRRVVYRAVRGKIHEIDTAALVDEQLSPDGAPSCAGNPAVIVAGGTPHVVYRSPDGWLHELVDLGGGSWTHVPLPCTERAAADPAVSVVDADAAALGVVTPFVAYRDRDGGFHRLTLGADGTWTCEPVAPVGTAALSLEAGTLAAPAPPITAADSPLVRADRVIPAHPCGVHKEADGSYAERVPEVVVIHTLDSAAGYAGEIENWHEGKGSERCYPPHYVIRNDGEITQLVAEKFIAAHANNWAMNVRAIGIEHDGYDNDPSYFTDEMYLASAALVRDICARWNIPVDRAHVIGHDEVPGQPKDEEHGDPGGYWDWDYYIALVRWDGVDEEQKPLRSVIDTAGANRSGVWHDEDRDSGRADWATARRKMGPLYYSGYAARYLWTDGGPDAPEDEFVEFSFTAPRAGHWSISAWWPVLANANRATRIAVVTGGADDTEPLAFDQHVADWRRVRRTEALPASPTWCLVGGVDLQKNGVVRVRVHRKSDAPGRVIADAVRFVNF